MVREPRFSERIGAVPAPVVQTGTVNAPLRFSIWNLFDALHDWDGSTLDAGRRISDLFARDFFKVAVYKSREIVPREWIYQKFVQLPWHGVYDFLEFVIENCDEISRGSKPLVLARAARILEEESAGYQYINGRIEPIATRAEAEEVERALEVPALRVERRVSNSASGLR